MARQVCAKLGLHKRPRAKHLIESRESLKCGRPRSKSSAPVTGRQNHAALQTQNRAGLQIRKHHALHAQRRVSNTAIPGVILVLKRDRNVHLDLISLPKPLLMNDVILYSRRSTSIHCGREHHFIFGISLLRHQRSRQVQLTPRPFWLAAEASQVADHFVDLLLCQRLPERRHDLRESAETSSMRDDGFPREIVFRSSLIAGSKIRKRPWRFKAGDGLRHALAVRAMTRHARRLVD